MGFDDRAHAGKLLSRQLDHYRGTNPLILAIPRGGLPVGRVLADELGGDLDVTLVHKLRSPDNREFPIGTVHEGGYLHLGAAAMSLGVGAGEIRKEVAFQLEALRRRRERYTPGRPALDPKGRIVIVVDDLAVTGSTLIAALRSIRAMDPSTLVAAIPVAHPVAHGLIGSEVDELACVVTSDDAKDPAWFYADFPPIPEEEAVWLLGARAVESPAEAWSPT